ncbi:MAG: hypothetical protein LC792_24260, partial [Actinobacteria bacterium]|nr:hypothetical protein [Actinomycetota bacterium]
VLCVASLLVLARPAAAAPLPAPVMRGYVPLEANATQKTMEGVRSEADTTLDFTVGITSAAPGAVVYYDQHEDGFEADLTNPQQSTTKVWGDNNPANGDASVGGICGPCTSDVLPAGAVFVLRNDILTPYTTGSLYDGGDRVSSTRGFTITAGGFSTPLGSVMSFSASAYDTTKWGTDYWIPVGENLDPPAGTSDAFARTSAQVMADQPGTVVQVDKNGDGTTDQTGTIGAGEVLFVDGGVNRGGHVAASKPVQVHVGAGDTTAKYELRWFTLFPTPLLSDDYLNPVGANEANQETVTYLFNPGGAAITVAPSCTGCSGTISVPAKGGVSYRSPLGQAVQFQSSGGEVFAAVGAVGSESGVGSADDQSSTFDWGYGLVPTNLLTTKALLGWAPGNSTKPPKNASGGSGDYDDDPVWISALGTTTLYVDYDGDPTNSTHTAPCGGQYDDTVPAAKLASVRIYDTTDGDMTGASIFSCDTKIAGAWGEDPDKAPTGAPGFDAGYTLIPSTSLLLDKTAALAQDTNGDGRFGPGDVIGYDIALSDIGAQPFSDVKVTDAVPAGTSYVAGSTTFDTGGASTPIADDGAGSATPYPFDEGGANVPEIQPGQTGHIRYQVAIKNPFPAGTSVTNLVKVDGPEDAEDKVVTPLVSSDLSLDKI